MRQSCLISKLINNFIFYDNMVLHHQSLFLTDNEVGEDEEADPEYNILEEDTENALDLKEEMRIDRAVQISKKEIHQLTTELLDMLDNGEESDARRPGTSQYAGQRGTKKSPVKSADCGQSNIRVSGVRCLSTFKIGGEYCCIGMFGNRDICF